MASQIDHVIQQLRSRILAGTLAPGERVIELQTAAELDVSRTPLRIALGELEKEGLLERLPTRGFRVRAFSLDAISDAIDVRGALEGLAAQRAAELGLDDHALASLRSCVEEGRSLVEAARVDDMRLDAAAWIAMNARFHETLVTAAGNEVLAQALALVSKAPMAGAGSLGLNGQLPVLEFTLISRAQQDHEEVVAAIVAREGSRARALMVEHARRSRDNKRKVMAGLHQVEQAIGLVNRS
ncbi:GntR family transcriptional regulator [soil metagenome]